MAAKQHQPADTPAARRSHQAVSALEQRPAERHLAASFRRASTPAALGPADVLALQRSVGNRMTGRILSQRPSGDSAAHVQRHCFDKYDTYDEAKQANPYSKKLLSSQKSSPISAHFQQGFQPIAAAILEINMGKNATYHSDTDPTQPLYLQDMEVTPHVDHRFPKSKNGTNSFKNARVISASDNITKGNKVDTVAEPNKALKPYQALSDEGFVIGPQRNFTPEQKNLIYAANKAYYGAGSVVSDLDKVTKLAGNDSSEVAHIDHIMPRSGGGCNYAFNAAVLPADENISKGGEKNMEVDIEAKLTGMSLDQYFKKKQEGKLMPTIEKEKRQRFTDEPTFEELVNGAEESPDEYLELLQAYTTKNSDWQSKEDEDLVKQARVLLKKEKKDKGELTVPMKSSKLRKGSTKKV